VDITLEDELAALIKPGSYVLLQAADSGAGMDEATLSRAFEPFFTTKDSGKGTGLGLSSAYGIVKQSGGYVTVESEIGAGTAFRVYLPQYLGPISPRPVDARVDPVTGGSETILLVEDEPALRELARQSLEPLGYRLLIAREATEALAAIEAEGTVPLLVTDIRLPGLDGTSLAAQLRDGNPTLRVLYVSGYAGDTMVSSGLLRADEAFLAKPFTGDELARRIRALLDA
jgi:CheY-like chemotaxis protein